MPQGVLADFAAQIPAIEASESLQRVSEMAVGSGRLKRTDARRIIRTWQREANRGQQPSSQKPRTKTEHHAMLAAAGIGVG